MLSVHVYWRLVLRLRRSECLLTQVAQALMIGHVGSYVRPTKVVGYSGQLNEFMERNKNEAVLGSCAEYWRFVIGQIEPVLFQNLFFQSAIPSW